MNKPFLLIAGFDYYPDFGTNDWIECFKTLEEAESSIIKSVTREVTYVYINGVPYDWYKIVDLREWTEV